MHDSFKIKGEIFFVTKLSQFFLVLLKALKSFTVMIIANFH
jgi:hypothetical protein